MQITPHSELSFTKVYIDKQSITKSEGSYKRPLIWFCSVCSWKQSKIVNKSYSFREKKIPITVQMDLPGI